MSESSTPGDTFVAPFLTEEIAPAHSDFWQSRREAARALRRLIQAVVTSEADASALAQATGEVDALAGRLEAGPRLFGESAYAAGGRHGTPGQVNNELNAVGGHSNPLSPGINMWVRGNEAFGEVRMGHAFEGPPGHVHGGHIAAVLDQFLGMAQVALNSGGMTARLNIRYQRPTPLNVPLTLWGRLERQGERKIAVTGEIRHEGIATASAEALFIRPRQRSQVPFF